MLIDLIKNGEAGASVRAKLNQAIEQVNAESGEIVNIADSIAVSADIGELGEYRINSAYVKKIGSTHTLYADITIDDKGTADEGLRVAVPGGYNVVPGAYIGAGRSQIDGVTAQVFSVGGRFVIRRFDNLSVIKSDARIRFSITYEA